MYDEDADVTEIPYIARDPAVFEAVFSFLNRGAEDPMELPFHILADKVRNEFIFWRLDTYYVEEARIWLLKKMETIFNRHTTYFCTIVSQQFDELDRSWELVKQDPKRPTSDYAALLRKDGLLLSSLLRTEENIRFLRHCYEEMVNVYEHMQKDIPIWMTTGHSTA